MCEPEVIHGGGRGRFAGTHLSVAEHQAHTVANFLHLCELWPGYSGEQCPIMPVLQAWAPGGYWRCADLYDKAGVRLEDYPVVGLGSVCRRQGTPAITRLIGDLTPWIALHGFGPVDNATDYFDAAIYQVRASATGSQSPKSPPAPPAPQALETDELTILTGWAQAAAEALAYAPERARAVLADARPGAAWRAALEIPEPSTRVSDALECVAQAIRLAAPTAGPPTFDTVLIAPQDDRPDEHELARLGCRVLRSTLELRRTWQARDGDHDRPHGTARQA